MAPHADGSITVCSCCSADWWSWATHHGYAGWVKQSRRGYLCPACAQPASGAAWASAGTGQTWAAAGGAAWATAGVSADGAWAQAGDGGGDSGGVLTVFEEAELAELLDDSFPRAPFGGGADRLSATRARPARLSADAADIDTMKKVFAAALIAARHRNLLADFSGLIERGQAGMEYAVQLDGSDYYVKTAGDVLQCRWLALHRADAEHAFTYNKAQAAFSAWIQLPRLVHGLELGSTVAAWKEHALADHNEALTYVLSPKLLHAYAELQAVFHRLFVDRGHGETLCTWRAASGALCPRKRRRGAFCREHARHAVIPAAPPPASLVDMARADGYCCDLLGWMARCRDEPRGWKAGQWAALLRDAHPDKQDADSDRTAGRAEHVTFLKEAKAWFVG